MSVSVETLQGLERKITISIPSDKIESALNERLKTIAPKVKVDGFRPGKVPMHVVKNRYSHDVRLEVTKELMQESLYQTIQDEKLKLAGYPSVEPEEIKAGQDFTYHAIFEVMPEFDIVELNDKDKLELVKAEVSDKDVDEMIEKMREQSKEWSEVKRKSAEGDQVNIDFKGFIGDEAFEGGEAQGFDLELGSGSMIPGFEEGITGGKAGDEFDIKVTFPKDYGKEDLAGKEATFKIKVNSVLSGKLPKLDDAFAEKFNVTEGGVEALKKDIRQNMERELERRVNSMNRDSIFEAIIGKNEIELPNSMIDREIEQLKHEMFHRIYGPQHSDNEKIPDFPREIFLDQAKKRVHLGLLFAEYVDKHNIEPTEEKVNAMIDTLAAAYVDPQEFKQYYTQNEERLNEVKALVTEEMVAEHISSNAKVKEVKKTYQAIMNPEAEEEMKDEKKETKGKKSKTETKDKGE